ncbi:hypothetical protein HU200_035511 [Digitaria exilis]|uniref:USP domain-containing protein n=1 Tax=Digitaria exilis TaxID=1010633 RepID=A0A835EIY6_9POAL|nr:hypothetical protein HU200_035511 [Digitaria exilis]
MAEVSTAAAPEGVLHRKIEFHLARRPHSVVALGGGGFRMETLNPDAAGKAGAAAAAAGSNEGDARRPEKGDTRRPEKGDAGGIDPELSVARIYLGRIWFVKLQFLDVLQGAGLQNLGNTCYLNSVLQCLTGIRLVKHAKIYSDFGMVKCTRCSHCSNKFDPFLDLSLDIAKATTLVRALQNFTEEELLDGGQKQYQCERCRQKVVAKKRFTIDKAPNVLTVHLKRFSPFNPREKIDKKVEFQPVLDLKPFVSDSKVRQVREADVLKQKAYMLFYVRDSIGNSVARKNNSTANLPTKKTPEKISTLNCVTQNSVKTQHLNGSSPLGDKMHSSSNVYSTIFGKASAEHFSKNEVKSEDAASSQSNGLPSSQALEPRNDGVTLSTKSVQCSANGKESSASASHQPESFTKTCGKQTVVGKSLEEVESKAEVGKNTSVASPMSNAAGTVAKSDKLTSQPQATPFSKPTGHMNDRSAGFAAQTSSKKDTVSNSVEKPRELTGSVEHADNDTAKALPMIQENTAPGLVQVDCGKQISSGGSMQAVVAASCNGTAAKKVNLKSKKFVRYPVVNMWLGSKKLLVASLKPGKKTKHKRTRRRAMVCTGVASISCIGDSMNEQLASTSATAQSETVEFTSGHQKRSHASAMPKDDPQSSQNKQKVDGAFVGTDTSAPTANADILKSGPNASGNQAQSRENEDAKLGAPRPVSICASDLMDATG